MKGPIRCLLGGRGIAQATSNRDLAELIPLPKAWLMLHDPPRSDSRLRLSENFRRAL